MLQSSAGHEASHTFAGSTRHSSSLLVARWDNFTHWPPEQPDAVEQKRGRLWRASNLDASPRRCFEISMQILMYAHLVHGNHWIVMPMILGPLNLFSASESDQALRQVLRRCQELRLVEVPDPALAACFEVG